MNYQICDTIKTGYGWITPENKCIQVANPSDILPALKRECKWIRAFYNTRGTRDDKFFYDLHNFIYSKGYVRVSKYKDTLAVETNDADVLTEKNGIIQDIRNTCGYRGSILEVREFIVSPLDDSGHELRDRFTYFPRH